MTRRETATKAISGGSERFQSVKTQKTDGRKMVFCRFFFVLFGGEWSSGRMAWLMGEQASDFDFAWKRRPRSGI